MTDFPPMHAVTRLGRVIQQLRSFGELHADELEATALELDAAGATELATRLRVQRDIQRDECQIVVDELVDIQTEAAADQATPPTPPETMHDPAIHSPKRARWLAEQAAEVEQRKQPISRRGLFGGVAQTTAPTPEPPLQA